MGRGIALVPALVLATALFGVGCGRDFPRPPAAGGDALPASGVAPRIAGTGSATLADDAAHDGWSTEVLNSTSRELLADRLGAALEKGGAVDPGSFADAIAASAEFSALVAESPQIAFDDGVVTVRRQAAPGATRASGAAGLAAALGALDARFAGYGHRHAKFKQFAVAIDPGGAGATTRLYFQMSGASAGGGVQLHAVWDVDWELSPELRIAGIVASDFEDVAIRHHGGAVFADVTESAFGAEPIFDAQIRPGVDHWTARLDVRLGIDVGGWQGVAVADADGDGRDDIYIAQPGGLPNRLFVQNPDGTVRDVAAAAGVDWIESTHGALFADLDNDGDQDLVIGVQQGVLIEENDGRGVFTVRFSELMPPAIPYSIASADYDQDGDLDLYVCGYNPRESAHQHLVFARPVPYHDANNGGRNMLLRNEGDWRFAQATREVGLDANNTRFSYAAAWEDYDDDGDLDLYVANDFGRNNLFRNDDGRFVDVAAEAGVEDISPGMSACWGDYDADGRVDLYVSNMFSSAGNRITEQAQFHRGASDALRAQLRRHARGNSLFRNLGGGAFEDVSVETGVVIGRWAWGSKFVDLNGDGYEDLVVTNGFITQEDTGDL